MKQTLSLLKVQFKQSYRKGRGAERSKKGKIGMAILYAFCFIVLAPYLFVTLYSLAKYAIDLNAGREYIAILMFIIQGFALLFGTVSLVNVMFLSKDNEILLSLPLPYRKIFTAKFLYVLLHELALGMFVGFVGMGIYGYLASCDVMFYILCGLAVIIAPIIALAVSSILLLPIILICASLRKTPILAGLVSLALFGGGMYVYMQFIFGLSSGSGQIENAMVMLFEVIADKLIFNTIVADVVLLMPNFAVSLGYAVTLYAGLFLLACVLTSGIYKKASTLITEKSSGGEIVSSNVQNSVLKSLISRDLKCILRFPMLMMSCVSQIVLAPIVILIMSGIYSGDMADIQFGMIFFMGTMFVCGTNYFASSSFTRENTSINILKTIPVSVETIITSKLILAIASMVITDIFVFISLLLSGMNIAIAVMFCVYFVAFALGIIAWQIRGDLDKPKLGWTNVNEGLKNNKAATVPLFVAMGLGMIGMFAFFFISLLKPSFMLIVMALVISLCGIFSILQMRSLYKNADRLFAKIEF